MQLRLRQHNIFISQADEADQWLFHLPVFLYWELEQPRCRSPPSYLIAIQEIKIRLGVPIVEFCYSRERAKFERAWIVTARRYRDAGMCCEQINAMEEFEEQAFRNRRIYHLHIQADFPKSALEQGKSDAYFTDLDSWLENQKPGASLRATERDKEILKIISAGYNQRETAEILGIRQQVVSRHLAKIKKILQKGV